MSTLSLLNAAARAYALVCYSDGRMPVIESGKFAAFVTDERALSSATRQDVDAAWKAAVKDMAGLPSYEGAIVDLAARVSGKTDAEVLMRAGEKALIADGRLEPQENGAIRALALALKLNPDAY